ncbi:MAG: carboxypeptidase regulatory-like domain-containing protein [Clostridiales bacterium]|nr:carboxypeptidase regulatory-like domain-containing protein [Clostridiales bacterium]
MNFQKMKKRLSWVLVLGLVVTSGMFTYAGNDPGSDDAVFTAAAGLAAIDDGTIRVTVDEDMSMAVYHNAGGAWVQTTTPIEKMGADGATADGVSGAWKNALPWSAATGTGTTNFFEGSAKILSDKAGYVTTGAPNRLAASGTNAGTDAGEALLSDSFARIGDGLLENNVQTHISKGATGKRLTVEGYDADLKLKHTVVLETGAVLGAMAVTSYYTYDGEGSLAVTKFVDNNFKIEATPLDRLVMKNDTKRAGGLWSWQGCDIGEQTEKVSPVFDTMGTRSVQAINSNNRSVSGMTRNNWNWTRYAGVAYNFMWGQDVGFGIGSLMPYHVYGLELPVRGSGLAGNHNIGYTWVGWPGKTLVSGEKTYIGTSMIGVVDGDMGSGTNLYGRTMDNVDITPFIDRGDFISRTDTFGNWSYVVNGVDYAKPRYEYDYAGSTADYKGVPKDLLVLPKGEELPSWGRDPIWETWGYGQSMAPRALFYLIPVIARLGYGSVTYDAYWYDHGSNGADPIYMPKYTGSPNASGTCCDWGVAAPLLEAYFNEHPHSKHTSPGDAYDFTNLNISNQTEAIRVVRAMNEYIHEHGMHAIAWVQSGLVLNPPANNGYVPDAWRVRDAGGATVGNQGCCGNPEFVNTATTYISELIYGNGKGELAFDGYKGDTIYGINPCYATGHGHDGDPYASMRNYGLFFKNLYDKANYVRGATEFVGGPIVDVEKMAMIKQCFCGMVMDYYAYSGINRPIWGDHNGTKQNRQGNRIFRGFYGWEVPMDSDHHDCDFRGNQAMVGDFDYASDYGTGMVYASKTRVNLNVYETALAENSSLMTFPGQSNYNQKTGLTGMASGSIKWGRAVKYYGLYQDLKTAQSRMLDGLYKYVVDYPEAYALELLDRNPATGKLTPMPGGDRVYSFYATSFPIDASDPYLRGTSNTRFYREVMNNGGSSRTYDPWNSVYKDLPNTTNTVTSNVPFTFTYEGPIEIRGLNANTAYCLTDVETGKKETKVADADGIIAFDTVFVNSVVYHVAAAETGSVSGFVYNAANATLPGATITLYNESGDRVYWDTASDLDGFYSFPVVPAGIYTLTATFPKNYVAPTAGNPGPLNLDYFTNVDEYASQPFVVGDSAVSRDLGPNVSYYSASVSVGAESDIAKNVEFALTLRGAENVLTFEAEVVIDGGMLAGVGVEALNGFTVMSDIFWRYIGGGQWQGTATLVYKAGEDEGFTDYGPVDIAKFIFAPRYAGDTALKLAGVKTTGLVGENTQYLDIEIIWGEAVTNIDQRVFSKYDLNRDNVVDALDLGIMLLYCGFDSDSPDWGTLVKVNDSKGKGVTAKMCDVNGDGVIDMLDLLDLFIHYTK